jgi:AcrR family transcriptional regulator
MSEPASATSDPKRARILEAALEVCERRGVSAARMEEVAALAQVSKGTLYRFFESKEDLFLATLIASYEEGLKSFERDAAGDPREQLRALLDGLGKVLASVAPRARVLYQAWGVVAGAPEFETRLHDFLRRFHRDREEEFRELIVRGQRAGVFRTDVDAGAVAQGIGALLSGFIYRGAFDPGGASREALRGCFDGLILETLEVRTSAFARPSGEPVDDG